MISDKLPIGSIITIKNEIRKVMIIGYEENKYIGVLFPIGYINNTLNISFKHEDIVKIFYLGFQEG